MSAWFALLLAPVTVFGYIVTVLALTIWRLGPRGGDYRRRIHELIVARCAPDPAGRWLDVGCGSGGLAILLAKALPDGSVVGIDSSAEDWADPGSFRSLEHVRTAVTQAGAEIEEEVPLGVRVRLPFPLNGRKVLGRALLLAGTGPPPGVLPHWLNNSAKWTPTGLVVTAIRSPWTAAGATWL